MKMKGISNKPLGKSSEPAMSMGCPARLNDCYMKYTSTKVMPHHII